MEARTIAGNQSEETLPHQTTPPRNPLAELAGDPERLGSILRAADAIFRDLPPFRNALVTWLSLLAARKALSPDPRSLALGLWQHGWKLLEPTERPRAGDVFLLASPDKRPTHAGIVAKVSTDGLWFTAIDDSLAPGDAPYRRFVSGAAGTDAVASFLRFG